jgi:hypothetical protein
LTLSTGLAMPSPYTDALALSGGHGKIKATFKGQTTINGSTEVVPDLTGRIGNQQFSGYGSGTTSDNIVQSGEVFLSNSQGSIQLQLGTASVTRVRRRIRQRVPILVQQATGQYAQWAGLTGQLTTWNTPSRPNATASFSGYLELT